MALIYQRKKGKAFSLLLRITSLAARESWTYIGQETSYGVDSSVRVKRRGTDAPYAVLEVVLVQSNVLE